MKEKIFGVKGIKRLNGKLLVLGIYQLNPKLKKWITFNNIKNKEEVMEKIKNIYEKFDEILKNKYFEYFENEFDDNFETDEEYFESEKSEYFQSKENFDGNIQERRKELEKIKLIY